MTFSENINRFTFGSKIQESEINKEDVYVRVIKTYNIVSRVERYVKVENIFRLSSLFKFDDQSYVIYSKIPEFNDGPEIYFFKECTRSRENKYKDLCNQIKSPD